VSTKIHKILDSDDEIEMQMTSLALSAALHVTRRQQHTQCQLKTHWARKFDWGT